MDLRETAGALRDAGYSVIPIEEGEKRPSVKWTPYQERLATDEELDYWFLSDPSRNIAIVTGRISNLLVIDIDPRNGGEAVVDGAPLGRATVVTGGGGYHYYYRPRSTSDQTKPGARKGIDLKAEGGYILVPPSKTSGDYRYTKGEPFPPERREIDEKLYAALYPAVPDRGAKMDSHLSTGKSPGAFGAINLSPVPVGGRNNHAAKLAGSLFYRGLSRDRVLSIVLLWNSCLDRPLPEAEIRATVNSIYATHSKRHKTN